MIELPRRDRGRGDPRHADEVRPAGRQPRRARSSSHPDQGRSTTVPPSRRPRRPRTAPEWIQAEKDAQADDPASPGSRRPPPPFPSRVCTAGSARQRPDLPDQRRRARRPRRRPAASPAPRSRSSRRPLGSGVYLNNLKLVGGHRRARTSSTRCSSRSRRPEGDAVRRHDRSLLQREDEPDGEAADRAADRRRHRGVRRLPPVDKIAVLLQDGQGVPARRPGRRTARPRLQGARVVQDERRARAAQADCASCHARQNGGATSAMDMTGVTHRRRERDDRLQPGPDARQPDHHTTRAASSWRPRRVTRITRSRFRQR